MPIHAAWTRNQLLVAFHLYCQLPFGRMHSRNPLIVQCAERIGRTPSALAMKLTNIASLDPAITSSGRKGLVGASATDRAMWEEIHLDWSRFCDESRDAMKTFDLGHVFSFQAPREDESSACVNYEGKETQSISKTRVGQAFFRRSVLSSYEYRCCITGLAVPELLVASHILPWRVDAANRLNPRNGLCLNAIHDRAFDQGIITVTAKMTI
ncbi:MAG: HNH endonuclease, partial [Candidatus Hydrogenedentes bacterium]|nr:HNH endonuclease [Candidatus Hydrogenedentota bacterium]